jgi:hypothetical protein
MNCSTADILLEIEITFVFSHVSVCVWLDVKMWWLGEREGGVLKLLEVLQINCVGERNGCWFLCDRDYRKS